MSIRAFESFSLLWLLSKQTMFHYKRLVLFCIAILPLITVGTQLKATRSYDEIEKRILELKGVTKEKIGQVAKGHKSYSLYLITVPPESINDSNRRNILISGGIHGDEPAGVYAVLEFLEKDIANYVGQFRFYIFPCMNPWGFEWNAAENLDGENLNRQFSDNSKSPAALVFIQTLKRKNIRFDFSIDMHEIPPYWEDEGWKKSDNPRSAYLYETQNDPRKRIGPKMIEALPPEIEVCKWKTIYGDKAINGVVSYPEGNGNAVYAQGTSFDSYLHRHYTSHSFTNETPIDWPLEKRVKTQLSWLKTALKLIAK